MPPCVARVDQPILISSAFAQSFGGGKRPFVSVGRYALRGVGKPQELFTLDTEAFAAPADAAATAQT